MTKESIMNRTQMMKQHGLECANIQWSWIFVNHTEKFIVVQKFNNSNIVYEPTWGRAISRNDFMKKLKLLDEGYTVKTIEANGHEENGRFHVDGYGKTLFDSRLEIDEDGLIRVFFN